MTSQIWWFVSRSTGIVAWVLATASVIWGLALSTRALGRQPRAPWLLDLHRHLGGLTTLFVLAHVFAIWADSFVEFDLTELLVPGSSDWKPEPVAWGIVGLYLLLAVELTSLAKKRLPNRLWHAIHLFSYFMWVASTVHFLRAGTDAQNLPVQILGFSGMAVTLFFLVYRWSGPGRAASVRAPAKDAGASKERIPATARIPATDATPATPDTDATSVTPSLVPVPVAASPERVTGSDPAAEQAARLARLAERRSRSARPKDPAGRGEGQFDLDAGAAVGSSAQA